MTTRVAAVLVLMVLMACKDNRSSKKTIDDRSSTTELQGKTEGYPELTFKDDAFYDFGVIKEGAVVEHEFFFTNTGEQPLKVVQAKPSCGCTAPDWTKGEIAPGEEGSVTVRFDSRGRLDQQNKSVRLITNTKNGNESVRFTAFVEQ